MVHGLDVEMRLKETLIYNRHFLGKSTVLILKTYKIEPLVDYD